MAQESLTNLEGYICLIPSQGKNIWMCEFLMQNIEEPVGKCLVCQMDNGIL